VKRPALTVPALLAAIAGVVCIWHLCKGQPERVQPQTPLLSVEETVELAVTRRVGEVPLGHISYAGPRLNPAGRPKLYEILGDKNQSERWPGILCAFEWIGQAEDVPKLESFLRGLEGKLGNSEMDAVVHLMFALGAMAHRGIPEAKQELREMLRPAYWQNVKFETPGEDAGGMSVETTMRMLALAGSARSGCDDFPTVAESVLSNTGDPVQRDFLQRNVKGQTEIWESFKGSSRCGREKRPAGRGERLGAEQGRLGRQGGVKAGAEEETAGAVDVRAVLDEAIAAYERVGTAWIDGRYGDVAPYLADDGYPVLAPAEQTPQRLQAVADGLSALRLKGAGAEKGDVTGAVLKELGEGRCRYGKGEVVSTRSWSFTGWDKETREPVQAGGKVTVVVRVTLPGTREIAQRHLRLDAPSSKLWRDGEGDLVIYMFKTDDHWYWNPFGW
jgi:hypothetical protein